MKKLTAFIALILSILCFSACKQQEGLERYVSQLRSDVFYGESQSFTIKGGYGYNETPFNNDGNVSEKVNLLTLKLLGKETERATYSASLEFKGQKYTSEFKFNPVTHSLISTFEIEDFDLKEFSVNVSSGDKTETITLKSQVPLGTISYVQALEYLEKNQPELIKAFSDAEGNFNAEIYARIIIKNDKAYWYVGLAGGNELLKALLIDGATGEVLAIREII